MKIHDDLSNDDLIDLLIKKGFRPDRRKERNCPTENSGALAVDAEVKQDASMGEGGDPSADLQASERPALRQYHPLESVWHGEDDAELIEQLLALFPHTEPRLILDSTVERPPLLARQQPARDRRRYRQAAPTGTSVQTTLPCRSIRVCSM